MRMNEVLSRPHDILDSVTLESFAKDCEVAMAIIVVKKGVPHEKLAPVRINRKPTQKDCGQFEGLLQQANLENYCEQAQTKDALEQELTPFHVNERQLYLKQLEFCATFSKFAGYNPYEE